MLSPVTARAEPTAITPPLAGTPDTYQYFEDGSWYRHEHYWGAPWDRSYYFNATGYGFEGKGYGAWVLQGKEYIVIDSGYAYSGQEYIRPFTLPAGIVQDLTYTVEFAKGDDPLDVDGLPPWYSFSAELGFPDGYAGPLGGYGLTFNREIAMWLVSPRGTRVDLITPGTYSGQSVLSTVAPRATVTFSDAAGTGVGGPSLVSGTFAPSGSLADFNGEDAAGTWFFHAMDMEPADPLMVIFPHTPPSSPEVTPGDPEVLPIPEPSSLVYVMLGVLSMQVLRMSQGSGRQTEHM